MIRKEIGAVLMIFVFFHSAVSAAYFNMDFDDGEELNGVTMENFSIDAGATVNYENGYLLLEGNSVNTGITYIMQKNVTDDIVNISFKVNKTESSNFKVYINDVSALAIFKRGSGAGSFFAYLPNDKYAHFNKNIGAYFPCDNQWAKITLRYDLKNGRLRVFENDMESQYITHNSVDERWNEGMYIEPRINSISKISFKVNGNVKLDEINVSSEIYETIKEIQKSYQQENYVMQFNKLAEYRELGYSIFDYEYLKYNKGNNSTKIMLTITDNNRSESNVYLVGEVYDDEDYYIYNKDKMIFGFKSDGEDINVISFENIIKHTDKSEHIAKTELNEEFPKSFNFKYENTSDDDEILCLSLKKQCSEKSNHFFTVNKYDKYQMNFSANEELNAAGGIEKPIKLAPGGCIEIEMLIKPKKTSVIVGDTDALSDCFKARISEVDLSDGNLKISFEKNYNETLEIECIAAIYRDEKIEYLAQKTYGNSITFNVDKSEEITQARIFAWSDFELMNPYAKPYIYR